MTQSWQTQMETELERAERARREVNEGMARVCARRAAGAVIREFLARQQIVLPRSTVSAMQHLKYLRDTPSLPLEVRTRAGHFLMNITPDHVLPVEADLVSEARWLAAHLLGDPEPGRAA